MMQIVSWNCKNLKTNGNWLLSAFPNPDLILLQETWLFSFEHNLIEKMFSNYYCVSSSSMKDNKQSLRGRPYGGSAILLHEKYKSSVIMTDTSDPRMAFVKLKSKLGELLVVNVYFPCNTHENTKLISKYFAKVHNLVSDHDGPVLVIGDFNICPTSKLYDSLQNMFNDLHHRKITNTWAQFHLLSPILQGAQSHGLTIALLQKVWCQMCQCRIALAQATTYHY